MRSLTGKVLLPSTAAIILIAAILLGGCMGIPAATSHLAENNGSFCAYFLDAGQGDASVILYNGTVILIDAGDADEGSRIVSDLRTLGADHIDLLVATHPHTDHIGGMREVLAAFPVDRVLEAGIPHTSSVYEEFLETIDRKGIPYITAERGLALTPDPDLRILVLSPPKERIEGDLNANSIVLKISYGTISFLFTGDAGTAAEDVLLATGVSPRADILKVSHHGSADATSARFIAAVRPQLAVISLAADNPYGYPHRETQDILTTAGVTLYRTDRDGTILIRSDGISYSVATENGPGRIQNPAEPGPVGVTTPPALPSDIPLPEIPAVAATVPQIQIGNPLFVRIDAVQFNAPGDDRKNLNGEWVRITNSGTEPVLLAGWTLSDTSGIDPYIFPAFFLMPERAVTLYTGSGIMNDTALFMGKSEPLFSNSGDTAFLRDGSGRIIDQRTEGIAP
jgi:competence protein ComEC